MLYSALCASGRIEKPAIEAVNALIRRGAPVDLAVAAATGLMKDACRLLTNANSEDRHCALALAAQFGHIEIVRLLLDAGEDPSRYNPIGLHSHSTPLHQSALAGHHQVVRLLVERGARLDIKDTLWQGTPAGWARYSGKAEIEEYLRARRALTGESACPRRATSPPQAEGPPHQEQPTEMSKLQ